MDETQAAAAVASGEIASPHRFANVWLFRLRITGTGVAERPRLNEIAIRNPADYLNEHFLTRCLGLPVVLEHPKDVPALDGAEFAKRTIGTIVKAFVEGDEVWGIAKIYDQAAARYMREHQLSTSPGVVYLDTTVNETLTLDDGKKVLIEGKPALLDHLAVVPAGVWDKGGEPTGIDITGSTERVMAERNDGTVSLDQVLAAITGLGTQFGELKTQISTTDTAVAALTSRFDAAEEREDARAKKDADEEEERRQSEELKKLAEEEEAEADRIEREDSLGRKDGESEEDHSKRCDAMSAKCDGVHFRRHDGEDEDEHSKRCDAMFKRRRDRRDAEGGTPDRVLRADRVRRDAEKARDFMKKDSGDGDREEEVLKRREEELAKEDSAERKDGEGDRDYSGRMDAQMRELGLVHLIRRAGETRADHAKRLDRFRARNVVRHDALKKDELLKNAIEQLADTRAKLAALETQVAPRPDADLAELSAAQARADGIYMMLGGHAPRPMLAETLLDYRVRLLSDLKRHSTAWKDTDVAVLARADATGAFATVERSIYDEARAFAMNPATVPEGQLREVIKPRAGGGTMHEFVGDMDVWLNAFKLPRNYVNDFPHQRQRLN